MPRPARTSELQAQLLELAFELYRIGHRLHALREGLNVPYEIAEDLYSRVEAESAPPTLELSLSIDELGDLAGRLRESAHASESTVRRAWRQRLEERQPASPRRSIQRGQRGASQER